jgi:DNA-binding NtrC family response regulator
LLSLRFPWFLEYGIQIAFSICGMNKILLIDDDFNFRKVLRHQLSGMGWQVDETAGIEAAIERCLHESYSLIILAINVPVWQPAMTILERIKQLTPGTPAVVISAFSTGELTKRFMAYGANDFLEKPCDERILRETVRRWIPTSPLLINAQP